MSDDDFFAAAAAPGDYDLLFFDPWTCVSCLPPGAASVRVRSCMRVVAFVLFRSAQIRREGLVAAPDDCRASRSRVRVRALEPRARVLAHRRRTQIFSVVLRDAGCGAAAGSPNVPRADSVRNAESCSGRARGATCVIVGTGGLRHSAIRYWDTFKYDACVCCGQLCFAIALRRRLLAAATSAYRA